MYIMCIWFLYRNLKFIFEFLIVKCKKLYVTRNRLYCIITYFFCSIIWAIFMCVLYIYIYPETSNYIYLFFIFLKLKLWRISWHKRMILLYIITHFFCFIVETILFRPFKCFHKTTVFFFQIFIYFPEYHSSYGLFHRQNTLKYSKRYFLFLKKICDYNLFSLPFLQLLFFVWKSPCATEESEKI